MNTDKLERDLQQLVTNCNEKTFIYDLLLAYGQPQASITLLQKGDRNRAKMSGEILWNKKLYFRFEDIADLHSLIDTVQNEPYIAKQHPRFIIVTDFETFLAVDTKTKDTLDIPFQKLPKHYDFFLPWAGMEKTQYQSENPADRKAAERMGRLYDIIREENPLITEADRHALNLFFARLLFCFFAEDTGIFADGQFTNSIASHTLPDGSDLQAYLQRLFKVLNLQERSSYPQFLQDFPYVNGGLFADDVPVPKLNVKSRRIIVESGSLNWKAINPDIFGSMMQAVVDHSLRDNLGMHYTSVVNIMKVIKPLFLDDLYAALERAGNNKENLEQLLYRLQHLRIFDPACGSGNFLIIVFKELCKLEIEIFKRLFPTNQLGFRFTEISKIKLTQFYGIEIDDFAHETAKLSLWLAEHQMNIAFKEVFGITRPTLPLQAGGNIVCGNATRLDWEEVCPKDAGYEIYVLGNPPYLGARNQDKSQKADVKKVLGHIKGYNNLDYIACWFVKAADYIAKSNAEFAFVSTNSISQGAQVAILWPHTLKSLEIGYAHQSFKWSNNAKGNAGVTCVITGLRNKNNEPKYLFNEGIKRNVSYINAYLLPLKDIYVKDRRKPLSNLPAISFGNMPNDEGHLLVNPLEKGKIVSDYPGTEILFRQYIGANEFLKGKERWCIWITDEQLEIATQSPPIREKIENVRMFRKSSKRKATRVLSKTPHKFGEIRHQESDAIIVPLHSSEKRDYIPFGFVNSKCIVSNAVGVIYNPQSYIFALISSRMHMTWVRAVAGGLETRIRYSAGLCYNTFPFPKITRAQKETLEDHVFKVLEEREKHSEKTMAQLYDPDKMPAGLRQAHREMDVAVEQCYRKEPFQSDEERLEYLFKLYEEMIEAEKKQGAK